jgi:OOP family OmpA-OmpF porin
MALKKFVVASSMLLLVSTACAATGAQQSDPKPTTDATTAPTGTAGTETTAAGAPVAPPSASPQVPAPQAPNPQAPVLQGTAQQGAVPAAVPEVQGTPVPATQAQGTPVQAPAAPGQMVPAASAYVPRTEHDNTPWRFNMEQDGKQMSADQFDEWMKQRGVRVATGKPATPLVQNCPTPEGDKGDGDGDGIINCLDQCPASEAGQTIGPDGCPVPVSIDLKGVTFAYDKASLGAEAKAVLDEAVEILQRHPALKVEVAGHTDSRGDAKYNQALSERRAQAVYDYLVEHGIDTARLIGPVGFGENRPLVPNQNPDGSDAAENRAKNRRTELNIQN